MDSGGQVKTLFGFAEPGSTQLSRIGGEEFAAGLEAWLAALPFPAAVRAFPRGLKAKTWQAI